MSIALPVDYLHMTIDMCPACFCSPCRCDEALLAKAAAKASPRRFTAEPPTGFGSFREEDIADQHADFMREALREQDREREQAREFGR